MSEENVLIVRRPMAATSRKHRSLEERLALRFPRLRSAVARLVWRLPSRRLRWAAVRRAVRLAWEAFNRDDFEATFLLYGPDTESMGADVWGTIGAEMKTRGRAERIAYQRRLGEEWEALRFEPEEMIEVGKDRLVSVGRMRGAGRASGATVETSWAVLVTIVDGAVGREQIFTDRDEALEAAGLPQ